MAKVEVVDGEKEEDVDKVTGRIIGKIIGRMFGKLKEVKPEETGKVEEAVEEISKLIIGNLFGKGGIVEGIDKAIGKTEVDVMEMDKAIGKIEEVVFEMDKVGVDVDVGLICSKMMMI